MMYAWSLLLISSSIAMVMANGTTPSLFLSRDQADPSRVVTVEFNTGGRQLTVDQYLAIRRAIVNALNERKRRSTTPAVGTTVEQISQGQTTATMTKDATAEVKTTSEQTLLETSTSIPETITENTTMTTKADVAVQKKRKRDVSWETAQSNYGNGYSNDDISLVNPTRALDDGILRISEILTKEDSMLSPELLIDCLRDIDSQGELQKAIGSPITLVKAYRGFPKVPKPEITQLQRIRRGVNRLREILGI